MPWPTRMVMQAGKNDGHLFINNPSKVEDSGGMPPHSHNHIEPVFLIHFISNVESRPLVSFKILNLFLFLQVNIFSYSPLWFILFLATASYLEAQTLAMIR